MPATPRVRLDASTRDTERAGAAEPAPRSSLHAGMQVTMVVRHRVAGRVAPMYEQWLARVGAAAQEAPGYLGAHVIRPVTDEGDYMFVPRFESPEHLARWSASARWLDSLGDVQGLLDAPSGTVAAGTAPAWSKLLRLLSGSRSA